MKNTLLRNATLFSLLLVLCVTAGCKKYPDGPEFSLLPKKWRLSEDWKTTKVVENGIDISSTALAHVKHESRNISRGGGFSYSLETDNGSSFSYSGSWSLSSDKTVIYFTYGIGSGVNTDQYLILRLKEDDLWLQNVNVQGDVLEYHYSPN